MTFGVATAYASEGEIAVHLAPSVLGYVGGLPITSTMMATWLSMLILITLAVVVRRRLSVVPGKLQSIFELLVGGLYQYVEETLESKKLAARYFPILITIFLFLLAMNWTGLLPGVASIGFWQSHGESQHLVPLFYPPATDLNLPLAFAFVAMFVIEMAGITALGFFKYGSKFINFSSPLNFVVGIIELISEIGRTISFSFRLFGNIFAGKTLLTVAIFFVPWILPVPLMAYELFVGFIQAAVFAFLTLTFLKLAVASPH